MPRLKKPIGFKSVSLSIEGGPTKPRKAMAKNKKPKAKKSPKFEKVMHEFGEGALHSGSKKGPAVTNPKQAVAIAFSESRKAKGKK